VIMTARSWACMRDPDINMSSNDKRALTVRMDIAVTTGCRSHAVAGMTVLI